jgi:deoxyadenosine/deoxycytidine kinase
MLSNKTEFADKLCEFYEESTVIRDSVEDNMYLSKFYNNPKNYALHTQLSFLLNRINQQNSFLQYNLFNKLVIADYFILKEKIYSELVLDNVEFHIYKQMFEILKKNVVYPDLLIYLQERPEIIYTKIKKNGKDYEQVITLEYLKDLQHKYNEFLFSYTNSPILIINTANLDFINEPDTFEMIIDEIENVSEQLQYFSLDTKTLL